MNRIKELNIIKFRHLDNIPNIKIGEKLTVIAGGNGTGKSSLLGLIGHMFSFRSKGTVTMNPFYKTLLETQFSEVFRFSPVHDYATQYSYFLLFHDGILRNAVSRFIAANKRFRIDVGIRSKRGYGKVSCPVIYLGLKRLIPLAQESEGSIRLLLANKLSNEDKNLYREWHNRVLVLEDNVTPQHMKSRNKEVYFPTCDKYDALGNSAGQDNLAQIILALLSFKRIKEELKDNYPGGILLIDEVETTLYPAAQYQLMHLLLRAAGNYDLQVIFTTHSTDIISYMLNPQERSFYHSTEIIYLYKQRGVITVCQEKGSLPRMLADLKHTVSEQPREPKVNVYLEDEEARIFFKGIVKSDLKSKLTISRCKLGADLYGTLLKSKVPEFRKSLIVLDGDQCEKNRLNRNPNVLFLPGSVRPENLICEFLSGLAEDDKFWESGLGGYDKQAFLNNKPANTESRDTMKQWFTGEKPNWGTGCSKLIHRWKSSNETTVNNFNEALKQKIERLELIPFN
ncbi:MAG TPA: AAA family ATPase [Bacteroidales bacterium]|nr:AAA family ATPase [Bacteroidales bacterium]